MDKIVGVPENFSDDIYKQNKIKIVSVKFGSKCTYVGKDAFRDCKSLETITFNNDNVMEEICDGAFAGCDKISSIKLPSGLKKMGDLCLSTTSELCIYIPDSLSDPPIFTIEGKESDDSYPFGYIIDYDDSDYSDDSDYYGNSDDSDIDYIIPQIKIFVPSNLVDKYKTDKHWGKYKDNITTLI